VIVKGEKTMSVGQIMNDALAKAHVVVTLAEASVKAININLGSVSVSGADFAQVAAAIQNDKISIKFKPDLGHIAMYYSGDNHMEIPFNNGLGIWQKALIVHEAVHASVDLRKMSLMAEHNEGLAYVAQAVYMAKNGWSFSTDVSFDWDFLSMVSWKMIFQQANRIASLNNSGKPVPQSEINLLYNSIRNANLYRSRAGKTETHDGV
jgi:hypothetical protein